MEKRIILIVVVLCANFCMMCSAQNRDPKKDGYVPDKETAIKVAESLWLPVFGDKIYLSKPFKAELKDEKTWIVQGTLKSQKGGVPYIEIQKADCKVLTMYHTK
jgi:hypothetical protein